MGKRIRGFARMLFCVSLILNSQFLILNSALAQAPGTAPVKLSSKTQMLHGKKYYVHIVEKGQTVYSIARAYKVESYDAVTHVDIHFLHPGDTVWLPYRGQVGEQEQAESPITPQSVVAPPEVRRTGKVLRMGLMMPLHLNQIDEISTSKFDIEQRGKKSYRQFEFIEFYEGIRMALDELASQGISVELNVADVSEHTTEAVERAFESHGMAQSDFIVALLFRDAFDRAAELAKRAGVYIVNPMSTRGEICAENSYMVKIQPSMESQVRAMLDNMKAERPEAHLYILHGGTPATEKPLVTELKRQLTERKDIKYTLFNWNQSSKLATTLKGTPQCHVLSIYDQKNDQMRTYVSNLLNRLAAFKNNTPTLYTFADWSRDYSDIDFAQLQLLGYHTFSTSWDMTNLVHVEFLKAFRERYGSEPTSPLAATGYDLTIYIVTGLSLHNSDFWNEPTASPLTLIYPLHLSRQQAGLENDHPQLFRMEALRFMPVGKGEVRREK